MNCQLLWLRLLKGATRQNFQQTYRNSRIFLVSSHFRNINLQLTISNHTKYQRVYNNNNTLFYSVGNGSSEELSTVKFDEICTETLESLSEYFEELAELSPELKNADIAYSDGVITANLGQKFGTYVINRQTPNKQIWLSSPTSGPKRYDFVNGEWIYKHDKTSLHSLLDYEISLLLEQPVKFTSCCLFGKKN